MTQRFALIIVKHKAMEHNKLRNSHKYVYWKIVSVMLCCAWMTARLHISVGCTLVNTYMCPFNICKFKGHAKSLNSPALLFLFYGNFHVRILTKAQQ